MTETTSPPSQTTSSVPNAKSQRVSYLRQMLVILSAGIFLATILTAWTPTGLLSNILVGRLDGDNSARSIYIPAPTQPEGAYPTPTARPRPRIGIVAGHWGNDSGAVCPDGLTEVEINLTIASMVKQFLTQEGFDVDLFEEFDFRLENYRALALVSIHADSCEYYNDEATGFKVAAALSEDNPETSERLTACLRSRYGAITGLANHTGSVTSDMQEYHAFDEIAPETTAAIIEVGFMNLDRQILTLQPDLLATGITKGVLCFINLEDLE